MSDSSDGAASRASRLGRRVPGTAAQDASGALKRDSRPGRQVVEWQQHSQRPHRGSLCPLHHLPGLLLLSLLC